MKNYNKYIDVFYRNEMSLSEHCLESRSKSPLKPQLLMKYINEKNVGGKFKKHSDFKPFTKNDFYLAHKKEYVNGFFRGTKKHTENIGIPFSKEFAQSVRYTNSSLYNSIKHAINNPKSIVLSPTSGFHHSDYFSGREFCAFAGEVISSSLIYDEFKLSGSFIDLDVHRGNAIPDSRQYVKNLNLAIPKGFNINPIGEGKMYINSLRKELNKLKTALLEDKIHYVVLCHGADSHKDDDLGCGSLTTEEWLLCSKLVYEMIDEISTIKNKSVPLILSLYGGYRNDNYKFVLDLHLQSILNSIK